MEAREILFWVMHYLSRFHLRKISSLLYSEKVPCQLRIFFGYNECRRVPIYYFDFPLPATTSEESQKNLADKTRPFFKRLFVFLFQTPLR